MFNNIFLSDLSIIEQNIKVLEKQRKSETIQKLEQDVKTIIMSKINEYSDIYNVYNVYNKIIYYS